MAGIRRFDRSASRGGPLLTKKLRYSREEVFADPVYARRIERDRVLFQGGLDEQGRYLSPRSLYRRDAIRAWTGELAHAGLPAEAMRFERLGPVPG
jgi:hypothetical protein